MLGVSLPHHNYVQPKTDAAHKTVETIGILHFKIQAVIIMWLSSIVYLKKKTYIYTDDIPLHIISYPFD